jgi:hypothetical protein
MKKFYIITAIVFFLSLFFGYAAGRGYKTYEISRDKSLSGIAKTFQQTNASNSTENVSTQKELVDPTTYAPKILKLDAMKDSQNGYNLHITTSHFDFISPEKLGKDLEQNTGYAYIYVNDQNVGRAYSEWSHIPENFFKPGTNTISVTLQANNYNTWWSKKGTFSAKLSTDIVYAK